MKGKVFSLFGVFAVAVSSVAIVILPFKGWDDLESHSSDIIIAKCIQTPEQPSLKDGVLEMKVQVEKVLKGTTNVSPSFVDSLYRLNQGQHYLIFANYQEGFYQAAAEYRVVPLGSDFSTNMILGASPHEQIQCLLRRRLNELDREMQRNVEERKRLTTIEGKKQLELVAPTDHAKPEETNRTRQDSVSQAELLSKSTNSADLFTALIDPQSGQYAAVSGDGRVISLKDKFGNPIWTNDIIAKLGTNLPMFSNGKIQSLQFIENQIVIYVGKECFCFDPQTGRLTRQASR